MKFSSLLLLAPMVLLFSCSGDDKKDVVAEKESYEVTKQNLKDKETKTPQDFLTVTGNDRHNLIGQTVVKGSISNIATVAVFKDADMQLDFYSKTRALLETDKETIYETIHPGETKNFKTKYFAPKGSDSVALKIVGAKIAE